MLVLPLLVLVLLLLLLLQLCAVCCAAVRAARNDNGVDRHPTWLYEHSSRRKDVKPSNVGICSGQGQR